jgi:iron complex outermembrane recepter protein
MNLSMRKFVFSLLATTALTNVAYAQTATTTQPSTGTTAQPTTTAPAATATTPATTTPATPVAAQPAPTAAATAAPAKKAQPAPAAASAAPAAKAVDFGSVTAAAPPPPPPSVALTQPGLTASPTDFAEANDRARAQRSATTATGGVSGAAQVASSIGAPGISVTPGGVTGQDIGGGYMIAEEAKKTRSTVTRDAIDKQSPTANPYQAINLLPGVIQSSPDNTGLNGGNIRMRGFNSDHIGMTVEGAPVNDSGSYALFPQEYTDGGNIAQISIAQGTPELDSPHIGATGGVINLYMRDPSKEAGGLVETSLGSNNLKRVFARVESGQVGAVRAFISYSRLTKDNWAGPGGDDRTHIDFKTVWDISKGNTVRFSAIYNEAVNTFYRNPTLAQFNNPNYKPGYLDTLPSTFFNKTSPIDQSANSAFDYYKYRINPFKNLILSAPSNFTLSNNLRFDTIPYFWYGFGSGGGTATVADSGMFSGNVKINGVNYGGTSALTDRTLYYNPSITETYRPGIINKFTYSLGDHKIVAGHWFEYASHKQTAPYVALNADGSVQDPFATDNHFSLPSTATCTITTKQGSGSGQNAGTVVACPTGDLQRRDQLTKTMTNMLFVGDTWKATDRLTFDYGVKYSIVNRTAENKLPDANPASKTLDEQIALPVLGASYKLNSENQVFGSLGTSYRSAPNFALLAAYSATNGAYTPAKDLEPETGRKVEVGHRYQGSIFATSISAFYGQYENFQQSTSVVDTTTGSNSSFTQTLNIGGLRNYGVNAEVGMRPVNYFRPYVSAELLKTEMLDNGILAATTTAGVNDYLRTQGNQLPGAPNYSLGIGIDFDTGHFFSNLSYKFIGPQYASYMNDEEIRAHGRIDASVGYRFGDVGYLKKPEIKLSIFNLLDERQLTGVNGITGNAQTTTGVNGRTISGSAPTYYMGQGLSGLFTFKTGF